MTTYQFIFTYLLGCIQIFLLIQRSVSTLIVIPTNNTYQDRIAAFGSHLPDQGLVAQLIPLSKIYPNDTDACSALQPVKKEFIALVLRGNCPFVDKVRNLQSAGAVGVVVGNDQDDGLVTMFASGDSSDIKIPSVFISHSSYSSLVQMSDMLGANLIIKLNPNDILQWPLIDVLIITILSPAIMMTLIYVLWRIRQRQIRKSQLAPISVVQNLPVKVIHLDQMKPNDPEVCAICLEDYIDDDQVRVMPCKHEFHIDCIDPWLTKRKKFCPICKKDTCPPTESTPLIRLNTSEA